MANLNETIIMWETKPESGKWAMLGFDGVLSEGHSGANTVTSYPVDSGFEVSDHTIRQNRQINLNTIISNISFNVATQVQSFENAFETLSSLIQKSTGKATTAYTAAEKFGRPKFNNDLYGAAIANALTSQVSDSKVDQAFAKIRELNALGTLVHCLTVRGWYLNCVIRSYTNVNDVNDIYCLPIQLTLEELNVVTTTAAGVTTGVATPDTGLHAAKEFIIPPGLAIALAASATIAVADKVYQLTEGNIPASYLALPHKSVPFSTERDINFSHNGVEHTLGRLVYSEAQDCFVTSLGWANDLGDNKINGIAIRSGVDLVQSYSTGLPSLVAVNISVSGEDVTDNSEDLRLYLVEDFQKYFVTGEAL